MMSVVFINAEPAHRHAVHVDSILEYANTLAEDLHFNFIINGFATDPRVNVHLKLLPIQLEIVVLSYI
jgi:hypothetical protein